MLGMMIARRGVSISRAIACLGFVIYFTLSFAQSGHWDNAGAVRAYQDAQQKRIEISRATQPLLRSYLECANTFRKVHTLDPHCRYAPESIYEEGLIYQEMGDRFADLTYYNKAISRFNLLIKDYGGNPNSPEALLRIGDIYLKCLNNDNAAQEAYQLLKTRYAHSSAAHQLRDRQTISSPASKPIQASAPDLATPATLSAMASVQNIRYWATSEYTRVSIDMNSDASYSRKILSNPNRLYLDIANSELTSSLPAHAIEVDGELLKQVRVAQNRPGIVRVVLDLAEKSNYSISELHDPFRIVIDLHGQTTKDLEAKRMQQSAAPPAGTVAQATALGTVRSTNRSEVSPPQANAKNQPAATVVPDRKVLQPPLAVTEIPASPVRTEKASSQQAVSKPKPDPSTMVQPGERSTGTSVQLERNQAGLPTVILDRDLPQPPLAVTNIQQESSKIEKPHLPEIAGGAAPAPSRKSVTLKMTAEAQSDEKKPAAAKPTQTASAVESFEQKTGVKNDISRKSSLPAATSKPAAPTSFGDRTLTRMLGLKIGRIVLDPGHGGHDLGTIGPGGLLEKDLALLLARDLQKLLQEQLGAEVFLTRNDDSFKSLEERTAYANQVHADLFVSIHANSSRTRSTSGVETYYLDFAKSASEREIAARENATTARNISELEDLIKQIAQADKSAESRELASIVQKRLYTGVRRLFPTAQNRGVRSAPFIVLIGANMPSILTEVAFISNPRDERLLKKAANQERLVNALYSGIEGYMKTLGGDLVQNQIKTK